MSIKRGSVVWGRSYATTNATRDTAADLTTWAAITTDAPVLPQTTQSVRRLLFETGTPTFKAASPKDEAIRLLQLAAEIEHALMVQYLYAAASIYDPSGPGGQTPFNKVMTVAVQEMGHLISVQNLLLSIGGPGAFHFGRDGIRANSSGNPIPLVLEAISHSALAKFVVAEMPDPDEIADEQLRTRVDALRAEAEQATHTDLRRVGSLYVKLFWLFQPDDKPRPPWNLTPAPELGLHAGWHVGKSDFRDKAEAARFEAGRDQWLRGSVPDFKLSSVTDADSALDLIVAIAVQGEGLGSTQTSHFFQFLNILDALEASQLSVTPLPPTPVARFAPAPDAGLTTPVVTPYAKLWGELFELRYSLLVLDLWHAIGFPNGDANRVGLIDLAYRNMGFLREMMGHAITLRKDPDSADAAPVFNLMHDDLPNSNTLRWNRHRQMLLRQREIMSGIRESPEFKDPTGEILDFDGNNLLANIEQSDVEREALISAGLGA